MKNPELLAEKIIKSLFTRDGMISLKKNRDEMINKEAIKLQNNNPELTENASKEQATENINTLFEQAERRVAAMIESNEEHELVIQILTDILAPRTEKGYEQPDRENVLKENKKKMSIYGPNGLYNGQWRTKYNNAWGNDQSNPNTKNFGDFWEQQIKKGTVYSLLDNAHKRVTLQIQEEDHNAKINQLISKLEMSPDSDQYKGVIKELKEHMKIEWEKNIDHVDTYKNEANRHIESILNQVDTRNSSGNSSRPSLELGTMAKDLTASRKNMNDRV